MDLVQNVNKLKTTLLNFDSDTSTFFEKGSAKIIYSRKGCLLFVKFATPQDTP